MTNTFILLAQEAVAEPNAIQRILGSGFVFPLALMAIFYFMLIRPQQQKAKALAKKIDALKKGDKIVTNGGIHGVINHKGDKTCSIRVSDGIFITVERSAIATVLSKGSDKPAADDKAIEVAKEEK